MEIKYLYGTVIAIANGDEDNRDNWKFEEGLALTRKTDIFQHKDMMQKVRINVLWGGFAKRFRKPDDIHFYGESISCNVETPTKDKHIEQLKGSYIGAKYWKAEMGERGRKNTVFLLLPDHLRPAQGYHETYIWSESSHAEMREIIDAEIRSSNGF